MSKVSNNPKLKLFFHLRIGKSKIVGKGPFACENILAGKKIGDMGGLIIPIRKARKQIQNNKNINIVELGNGKALNGLVNRNALSYINHSCEPNTFMRIANWRVEFYTLRNIRRFEELTCDYGETHHDGKLRCLCGTKVCRGFI